MVESAPRDDELAVPVADNVNTDGDIERHVGQESSIENEKKDLETGTPDALVGSDDGTEAKADVPAAVKEFKRPFGTGRWIAILVGIYMAAFSYGLDTTIAANIQGPILESLGEIEKLPWVGLGFPMGSLAVILLNGRLYGLFNIKYLLCAAIFIFEAGSAICGAAPTMNAMVCGRIIAGIGGSAMYIGGLTHMSVYTGYKERALYNSGLGLCWGIGCIVGPALGGGFADSGATWRWAFYINLPLAALCAPLFLFLFPPFNPRPNLSFRTKLFSIDWIGVGLNAFVFTVFQVALTLSGSSWSWHAGGTIALWVLFGVFAIVYAIQQKLAIFTTNEHRLFPIQFLRSRTILLLYLASSCTGTANFVAIYYIPLFFQFTRGDSAIRTAVRLLPLIIPLVFFMMVNGIFIIISGCLMHTVGLDTSPAHIYGYEVLLALGVGSSAQLSYAVAAFKAPPGQTQSAIGFMNVGQIGSITLALAIAGCIFENVGFSKLKAALAPFELSPEDIRNALGGSTSGILTGNAQARQLALGAIVDTIKTIWIMVIAAGAFCLVCAALMRREALSLKHVEVKK